MFHSQMSIGSRRALLNWAIVFWLIWLGPASVRCQSTTDSNLVCRSVASLVHWKRSSDATNLSFDLEAYLIHAGANWGNCRVEHQGKSIGFEVDPVLAARLSTIPAGTMLNFHGQAIHAENGTKLIRLLSFNDNLRRETLKPAPAKIWPHTEGTPLYRFGCAYGEIQEVLHLEQRTIVLAKDLGSPFEIRQLGPNGKLRPEQVGRRWYFEGCVRPNDSPNPRRPLHRLDLMSESQMSSRGPADPNAAPTAGSESIASIRLPQLTERIDGLVVFSDNARHIGIIKGGERFWVRTQLAHEISPGTKIRVLGTSKSSFQLNVRACNAKFMEVDGSQTIKPPEPAQVDQLHAMPRLPALVKLQGTVQYSLLHDASMDLHLKNAGEEFVVRMPTNEFSGRRSRGLFVEGTRIEFWGMPAHRELDPRQSSDFRGSGLWVYVGSTKDVVILSRPLTMSTTRLLAGGAFLLLALLMGGVWITWLRRRIKEGNQSLTAFDQHFQTAFGAMQCGVLIVDDQSRILRSNHRLGAFLGLEPSPKSRLVDCLAKPDDSGEGTSGLSDLVDVSSRTPDRPLSAELPMPDPRRTMRVFTCPIEIGQTNGHRDERTRLWLFEDISEKRQLELDLLQSQKMDAVGRLSGGIAHDFNNLLMVIQSSLGMIRQDLCAADLARGNPGLEAAELAVQRASELTQQLLGFARCQRLEKKQVDAVSLVKDLEVLASRMIKSPQTLVVNQNCDRIIVDVDRGRIEQALFNLCINAIDATKRDGGQVTLTISGVDDPNGGVSARFSVVDNGGGIPSEDQEKIFDPFFTTKPQGEGTGLGLSVALGIIKQHGGHVTCQSTIGQGTRFDIVLPAISEATIPTTSQAWERSPSRSGEAMLSVLVVEDDPGVRDASCSMLQQLGHQVDSVENAMMAIQYLSLHSVDLVLLDVNLPEMSGVEACQEIRSAWPHLAILFCSGHPNAAAMIEDGCSPDAPPLLGKPFTAEQFEASLESVVETGRINQRETASSI